MKNKLPITIFYSSKLYEVSSSYRISLSLSTTWGISHISVGFPMEILYRKVLYSIERIEMVYYQLITLTLSGVLIYGCQAGG